MIMMFLMLSRVPAAIEGQQCVNTYDGSGANTKSFAQEFWTLISNDAG